MGMPSIPEGRHRPTIFIVGDYPGILERLEVTIPEEQVRIIIATDGLSALPALAREEPELIFIDADLPGLDGYHICQLIRRNLEQKQAIIIILSRRGGMFDVLRGRIAGATINLKRPANLRGVVELIDTYARRLDIFFMKE